jgi:hypothetical protein
MSRKIICGLAPLFAVVAFAAMPTMASAVTLHANGKVLKVKAAIKGESENLVFSTEDGNIECTTNTVTGKLESNGEPSISSSVTTAKFQGTEKAKTCKTTTPLGRAKITPTGLPWTITFNEDGTSTVTGTPEVDFEAEFPAAGISCDFASASVADSFNFGGPLIDSVSGQKFVKVSGSVFCPTEGELNGSFEVFSGAHEVEATKP